MQGVSALLHPAAPRAKPHTHLQPLTAATSRPLPHPTAATKEAIRVMKDQTAGGHIFLMDGAGGWWLGGWAGGDLMVHCAAAAARLLLLLPASEAPPARAAVPSAPARFAPRFPRRRGRRRHAPLCRLRRHQAGAQPAVQVAAGAGPRAGIGLKCINAGRTSAAAAPSLLASCPLPADAASDPLQMELRSEGLKKIGVHNLSPGMVTTELLLAGTNTPVAR